MRNSFITFILSLAVFLIIAICASADSVPLPPDLLALYPTTNTISTVAVSSGFPGVGYSETSNILPLSWSGVSGGAAASVQTNSGFTPLVSATAAGAVSVGPNESGISRANAQNTYKYYFRIYDPTVSFAFVPLTFNFTLNESVNYSVSDLATLRAQAAAAINLPGKSFGISDTVTCSAGDCSDDHVGGTSGPDSWSFNYFQVNSIYSILLVSYALVDCGAGSDFDTGSSCSAITTALVDPQITVDPNFLLSHPNAQLQIGTFAAPAPVPEPPALLLLGGGLLIVFGRLRRKLGV